MVESDALSPCIKTNRHTEITNKHNGESSVSLETWKGAITELKRICGNSTNEKHSEINPYWLTWCSFMYVIEKPSSDVSKGTYLEQLELELKDGPYFVL